MKALILLAFCLAVSAVLCAADFTKEQIPAVALKRLRNVDTFAFGGVGYAGTTSKGELDFRIIMKQSPEKALADFENIYAIGTPEAKAYALAGIKKLNAARFQHLFAITKSSSDMVNTMRGCIVSKEHLSTIALEIDDDRFMFR